MLTAIVPDASEPYDVIAFPLRLPGSTPPAGFNSTAGSTALQGSTPLPPSTPLPAPFSCRLNKKTIRLGAAHMVLPQNDPDSLGLGRGCQQN